MLVDTPGIHGTSRPACDEPLHEPCRARRRRTTWTRRCWWSRPAAGIDDDALAYAALRESTVPCVLVVNKVDKIADKGSLLPFITQITQEREFAAVHPISALQAQGHSTPWSKPC